MQNKWSWNNCR